MFPLFNPRHYFRSNKNWKILVCKNHQTHLTHHVLKETGFIMLKIHQMMGNCELYLKSWISSFWIKLYSLLCFLACFYLFVLALLSVSCFFSTSDASIIVGKCLGVGLQIWSISYQIITSSHLASSLLAPKKFETVCRGDSYPRSQRTEKRKKRTQLGRMRV